MSVTSSPDPSPPTSAEEKESSRESVHISVSSAVLMEDDDNCLTSEVPGSPIDVDEHVQTDDTLTSSGDPNHQQYRETRTLNLLSEMKVKVPTNHTIGNIIKVENVSESDPVSSDSDLSDDINISGIKSEKGQFNNSSLSDDEQLTKSAIIHSSRNKTTNRHQVFVNSVQSHYETRKHEPSDMRLNHSYHPMRQLHLSQSTLHKHNQQQQIQHQQQEHHLALYSVAAQRHSYSIRDQHIDLFNSNPHMPISIAGGSGSRKLEAACLVCGDRASGKHYGVLSCDGCRGFFKRSIRRNMKYACKEAGMCIVDVARRNQCQACRFTKCLQVNMNRDAVQHERAPRCYQYRKDSPEAHSSVDNTALIRKCYTEATNIEPVGNPASMSMKNKAKLLQSNQPFPGQQQGLLQVAHRTMWDQPRLPYIPVPPYLQSVTSSTSTKSACSKTRYSPLHKPLVIAPNGASTFQEMHHSDQHVMRLNSMISETGKEKLLFVDDDKQNLSSHSPSSGRTSPDTSDSSLSHHQQLLPNSPQFTSNLSANVRTPYNKTYHNNTISTHPIRPIPSLPNAIPYQFSPATSFMLPSVHHFHHQSVALQTMAPGSIAADNVHETAAKLLFLSVKWARSMPSFLQLSLGEQGALLEESWCELFTLNAAQWGLDIHAADTGGRHECGDKRTESGMAHIGSLKAIIDRISVYKLDSTEYSCLKALTLYKSEVGELTDDSLVESLQDQAQLMLKDYISHTYPDSPTRFGRLMLLLPILRTVSPRSVEELFFRKTIGNVPIERLLCDMFKSC